MSYSFENYGKSSYPLMKVAVVGLRFMGATHLKAIEESADVVSSDAAKLAGDLSGIHRNVGFDWT